MDLRREPLLGKNIDEYSDDLRDFTGKLGLHNSQVSEANKTAAVLGVRAWLKINGIELENYKLAGKENIKTLSALLSRNSGSNVSHLITAKEYTEIVDSIAVEMEGIVLLVYEGLLTELNSLREELRSEVALSISYDFLASRSRKHVELAELLILNFFKGEFKRDAL